VKEKSAIPPGGAANGGSGEGSGYRARDWSRVLTLQSRKPSFWSRDGRCPTHCGICLALRLILFTAGLQPTDRAVRQPDRL